MNLQEKLQQLAIERQNLTIALHEINGAMKLLEQQILETQATSSENQPSNKVEEEQQLKTESSS
mgnify:CR=1 FL=1